MTNTTWSADSEFAGYEAAQLRFPDDNEGPVIATLVRQQATQPTHKAVLYIHGYLDYFFQTHVAERYLEQGYNVYALDLRKYGRSLLPHQRLNYCDDVREYFAEISAALRIICEEDGNQWLLLSGHSTGGLISTLYAAEGDERQRISALHLNSPFFEWNFRGTSELALRVLRTIAPVLPHIGLPVSSPMVYFLSIHADKYGEWDFKWDWRPNGGFAIYAGWTRAITTAHERVRAGLNLSLPVLLMYSDKSIYGDHYGPKFHTGDAVLNVGHIKAAAQYLGPNVTQVEIVNGLHDLALSNEVARERFFTELFAWLETVSAPQPQPVD